MATAELESFPNILEYPIPFIERAEQLRIETDPDLQATFKQWLLEQWDQINHLISARPFDVAIRPHGSKPGRTARTYLVPNGIFIIEFLPLTDDEITGSRVDLKRVSGPLGLKPEWIGNYRFHATFRVNRQRELRYVLMDYSVVGANQKSEPFLRESGFHIAMTPDINIEQLGAAKGF